MRIFGSSHSRYSALQWRILLVMTAMNFINYVDRQVVFPLFHLIGPEFQVTDFELGMLGTAFMAVHSLALVPFGVLADRISRTRIVAFGALFWSAATVLTGLASSYRFLLGIRGLVGIGESAYTPASASIISDVFPQKERAQVQAYFNLGMFSGGTVGMILGGLLGAWVGWRAAFFVVGLPGLVLAAAAYRTPDPILDDRSKPVRKYPIMDSLRLLLGIPAYRLALVAGTLVTFTAGAMITWGTEFAIRYYDFSLRKAAVTLAMVILLAGLLGVVFGGWLADRLQRRWPWGRALTIGISFVISTPFLLLTIYSPTPGILFAGLFVAAFFMCCYHGPATAVIHDITPPDMHGFSFAVYVFVTHLLGDMTSPAVVGLIADHYNLRAGLLIAALINLLGAVVFLLVAWRIRQMSLRPPMPEPELAAR